LGMSGKIISGVSTATPNFIVSCDLIFWFFFIKKKECLRQDEDKMPLRRSSF
jgi:hypothetical protein